MMIMLVSGVVWPSEVFLMMGFPESLRYMRCLHENIVRTAETKHSGVSFRMYK